MLAQHFFPPSFSHWHLPFSFSTPPTPLSLSPLSFFPLPPPGDISFTEFYNHIWNFNTAKDRLLATNAVTATQTKNLDDEEIARLVFDGLVGGDEVLEAAVLEELLCSWGLPPAEVREYFMEFDEDRNGLISFEEFQVSRPTEAEPKWG